MNTHNRYQIGKNARRMRARRMIAAAWKLALVAGNTLDKAERRAIQHQAARLADTAKRLYRFTDDIELALHCAIWPDDTRAAASLARVRNTKYGY